jgi:osmotically-inducible protein OsmY
MRNPTRIRRAAWVAALAAVTATAFAMNESEETTLKSTSTPSVVVAEDSTAQSLSPNEEIVAAPAPAASEKAVPVVERSVAQPPVTVETRRLSLDERIQGDVMDAIYNMPNISGKIGVESHDAVVTLTGYTMTGGQAWRAARTAGSIQGVRYVQNEIRPRVGATM